MREIPLFGAQRRAIKLAGWIVACLSGFFSCAPLLAQSTQFSFIGVAGDVLFAYSPDSCTTVNGEIFVSASGSRAQVNSVNPPPDAFASLFTLNSCTNPPTSTFVFGDTNTFQFASQGGNGTETPRVIVASGQIPMTNLAGVQVDVLSFQLTLNRVGSTVELDGDTHSTYPPGSPRVNAHFSNTFSSASATLTASTQSQGALPLSVLTGTVQNGKSHAVEITR